MIKIQIISNHINRMESSEQSLFVTFNESGGSIGRAEDNTLVLEDPGRSISRIHAEISFKKGDYYICGVGSSLPVYLNDRKLLNKEFYKISDGDKIRIHDYEMLVVASQKLIDSGDEKLGIETTTLGRDQFGDRNNDHSMDDISISLQLTSEDLSLNSEARRTELDSPVNIESTANNHQSVVSQTLKDDPFKDINLPDICNENQLSVENTEPPEQIIDDPIKNNEELKEVSEISPARIIPDPISSTDKALSAEEELLQKFLEGAGLKNVENQIKLTPQLMHALGQFMRESMQGTLDLLKLRAQMRQEIRAERTMIVPRENNPLKFSPNVEVALMHLLAPKGQEQGFMMPLPAIKNVYNDLCSHQIGFMTGIRAAFSGIIERFDPVHLEKRVKQKSMVDTVFSATFKAKLWDLYTERYEDISQQTEEDFRAIFDREFVKAYEEQLAKLGNGNSSK
ncbi:MAG: type VI secretion system-associated FHA domain protein TagH [Candidatus Omnitrophica bacterium]|nr:type VI secretion system-associated FHA domain protein TagH [Candidatus Omnitrophota bacterium]MCP5251550.1 type VI secretion system-associated FHA domain protein TagH [Burkholderiales bacterium]